MVGRVSGWLVALGSNAIYPFCAWQASGQPPLNLIISDFRIVCCTEVCVKVWLGADGAEPLIACVG